MGNRSNFTWGCIKQFQYRRSTFLHLSLPTTQWGNLMTTYFLREIWSRWNPTQAATSNMLHLVWLKMEWAFRIEVGYVHIWFEPSSKRIHSISWFLTNWNGIFCPFAKQAQKGEIKSLFVGLLYSQMLTAESLASNRKWVSEFVYPSGFDALISIARTNSIHNEKECYLFI